MTTDEEVFEEAHVVGSDGVCRVSLNGQGHWRCAEHNEVSTTPIWDEFAPRWAELHAKD